MQAQFYRFRQFLYFYWNAVTKYQLHSPFVFDLASTVLEDDRWYYAFRDVEELRDRMLDSGVKLEVVDFGAAPPSPPTGGSSDPPFSSGAGKKPKGEVLLPPVGGLGGAKRYASVRQITRQAASSPRQGQMLFQLANWVAPKAMLELGTSLGISTMYLASGMRSAKLVSLEGCPDFANVARANLEILGLHNAEIVVGEFSKTLPKVLQQLQALDFVFIDGNHRAEPTLQYFETCLPYTHERTVFVFDDMYWSPDMTEAWSKIRLHPRVTLTVDFFELSLAFIAPDFREKQHFKIVPARWKPWKFL